MVFLCAGRRERRNVKYQTRMICSYTLVPARTMFNWVVFPFVVSPLTKTYSCHFDLLNTKYVAPVKIKYRILILSIN